MRLLVLTFQPTGGDLLAGQLLACGAESVEVTAVAREAAEAKVRTGPFRSRRVTGRSLQLAGDPALIIADGIARQRLQSKRTFWSEPLLWRPAL